MDGALTALYILGIVSPFYFSRLLFLFFIEVDIYKYSNVCFGITFKWHVNWSYTAGVNLHLYARNQRHCVPRNEAKEERQKYCSHLEIKWFGS